MTFWSVDESMAVAEQQRSVHNWIFLGVTPFSNIFLKNQKTVCIANKHLVVNIVV